MRPLTGMSYTAKGDSKSRARASVVVGLLVVVSSSGACGGGGSGSSGATGAGGSSASTTVQDCRDACNECGGDLCVDCAATAARYRDDYETILYDCIRTSDSSCEQRWEECSGMAAGEVTRRAADDSYRDACLAKKSDCEDQEVSLSDDYCLGSTLLDESLLQDATACLDRACSDASGCLREIFR
jgi:hypothetical protein